MRMTAKCCQPWVHEPISGQHNLPSQATVDQANLHPCGIILWERRVMKMRKHHGTHKRLQEITGNSPPKLGHAIPNFETKLPLRSAVPVVFLDTWPNCYRDDIPTSGVAMEIPMNNPTEAPSLSDMNPPRSFPLLTWGFWAYLDGTSASKIWGFLADQKAGIWPIENLRMKMPASGLQPPEEQVIGDSEKLMRNPGHLEGTLLTCPPLWTWARQRPFWDILSLSLSLLKDEEVSCKKTT